MIIDVSEIVNITGGYEKITKTAPIDLSEIEDLVKYGDVTINLKLKCIQRGKISVNANGYLDAVLICDRCLSDYNGVIEFEFAEKFIKQNAIDETELDCDYEVFSGITIDFTDIVSSYIRLSIPLKKLCSESCLGICKNCGKNLNESKCNCK